MKELQLTTELQYGGKDMVKYVIGIVFYSLAIAIMPILMFLKCEFGDNYFKLIKIKKLSFLFFGLHGASSKKHGIIRACLVLQIIGYVLSITMIVIGIVWMNMPSLNKNYIFIVYGIVWFLETLASGVVWAVLYHVAKEREANGK